MPFSSLKDPIDLARAEGALDAAWAAMGRDIPAHRVEQERTRLVEIIGALAVSSIDEQELKERALCRYKQWYA